MLSTRARAKRRHGTDDDSDSGRNGGVSKVYLYAVHTDITYTVKREREKRVVKERNETDGCKARPVGLAKIRARARFALYDLLQIRTTNKDGKQYFHA